MKTKDMVLRMLTERKGRFVSGEQLSQNLGVTRTAVWKHIIRLKEEGYSIDAVSKKGYRLSNSLEIFNASAIISRLHTKIVGKEILFFDEIDSTNNELKRLAANGAEEGTVVIAEKQLSGRGRRGRAWCSQQSKGIYMSILLRPDIAPKDVQSITLAASSAVCKAIEAYTITKPGIKWPNDILLQNKKVCGILTEMTAEPDKVVSLVVGIGLNVYQGQEDFTEELAETATSLAMNSQAELSRSMLAIRILEEFEVLYLDFVDRNCTAKFLNIWRSFSITLGCDIIIYQGEKTWKARALDVLDNGCLLVEAMDGKREVISSGEISIRKLKQAEEDQYDSKQQQ